MMGIITILFMSAKNDVFTKLTFGLGSSRDDFFVMNGRGGANADLTAFKIINMFPK
jgi:hypothetical protein